MITSALSAFKRGKAWRLGMGRAVCAVGAIKIHIRLVDGTKYYLPKVAAQKRVRYCAKITISILMLCRIYALESKEPRPIMVNQCNEDTSDLVLSPAPIHSWLLNLKGRLSHNSVVRQTSSRSISWSHSRASDFLEGGVPAFHATVLLIIEALRPYALMSVKALTNKV